MERAQARRAGSVGQQDRTGRDILREEIIHHPVPLDMNILKALKRSSLGLDLYLWLTYRTFSLKSVPAFLGAPLPSVRGDSC